MIHVVGIDLANPRWQFILDALDAGAEDGVEYKQFCWVHGRNEDIEKADAYIYLDMAPIFKSAPWIRIKSNDTDEQVEDKLQILADMMFNGSSPEVAASPIPTDDCNPLNEPSLYNEDLTAKELEPCMFNGVEVKINGKVVQLNKHDLSALAKIKKLMAEYGYEIEKVIV